MAHTLPSKASANRSWIARFLIVFSNSGMPGPRSTRSLRVSTESGETTKLIAPRTRIDPEVPTHRAGTVRAVASRRCDQVLPNAKQRPARNTRTRTTPARGPVPGACENNRYVRENHLREAVVSRLRARLFPSPDNPDRVPDWFPIWLPACGKNSTAAVLSNRIAQRFAQPNRASWASNSPGGP